MKKGYKGYKSGDKKYITKILRDYFRSKYLTNRYDDFRLRYPVIYSPRYYFPKRKSAEEYYLIQRQYKSQEPQTSRRDVKLSGESGRMFSNSDVEKNTGKNLESKLRYELTRELEGKLRQDLTEKLMREFENELYDKIEAIFRDLSGKDAESRNLDGEGKTKDEAGGTDTELRNSNKEYEIEEDSEHGSLKSLLESAVKLSEEEKEEWEREEYEIWLDRIIDKDESLLDGDEVETPEIDEITGIEILEMSEAEPLDIEIGEDETRDLDEKLNDEYIEPLDFDEFVEPDFAEYEMWDVEGDEY
jgi:hypothetical protein